MINGENSKFYYGVMTQDGKEYEHEYPAIITRSLYNQCQLVKDSRKSMKDKYDTKEFALKRIVSCGKCGRRVSSFKSKQWVYLTCANPTCKNPNTPEKLVMGAIDSIIEQITIPEEWLEYVIGELRAKHDNHSLFVEKELNATRLEYDQITERLKNNYSNLLAMRITHEVHDEFAEEMKNRQEQLNDKLNLLTKEDKSFLITSSYLLDLARRVNELFKMGDESQRNELLGYVLSNLQLNDKNLSFSVNYPFSEVVYAKEKNQNDSDSSLWCG